MALINKDNESKWFGKKRFFVNLKEAIEYFDDPSKSPVALVTYMIKDTSNKYKLCTKFIQKEYDFVNKIRTFKNPLEKISLTDNFYEFIIPKDHLDISFS